MSRLDWRPGRVRLSLILAGSVVALGVVGLGWIWWRGRAERDLVAANQALALGSPLAALEWLPRAEADPTTHDRALILRARVALALGRTAEAVGPLNRVARDGPAGVDAAYWKGRTLLVAGQTAQAVGWLRVVVAARPHDRDAQRWLAVAAYDLGFVSLARIALAAVVADEPTDHRSWRTLALIEKDSTHFDAARETYLRTLDLAPDQPEARLELAETNNRLGRHDEAERELAACRGRVDPGLWSRRMAETLRGMGDLDRLKVFLATALTEHPDEPDLLIIQAWTKRLDGRPDDAVALLDRAMALDPYNSESFSERALLLHALGRGDEAHASRARATELAEASRELSRLDALASDRPDDAAVRCRLGQVCATLGKLELAASWYRAALACDPTRANARDALTHLPAGIVPYATRSEVNAF